MPTLERNCTVHCANTYISNNSDWVNVDTVISTSGDQTAIGARLAAAPVAAGRAQLLRVPARSRRAQLLFLPLCALRSGAAEVNGIDVEVYYLKEQPWNVPKMVSAVEKALAYYTTNFGPYYNKQARIIEFPRVATFARPFPEPCLTRRA